MIEKSIARLGAALALVTLGTILTGIWQARLRPKGRSTGVWADKFGPASYVASGASFAVFYVALWRPLPWRLSSWQRTALALAGALLYFPGLLLVIWSRLQLGAMYNVSHGLGAQLYRNHRLVTGGPYRLVRHPLYLGLVLASLGALLIYRTLTTVWLAASCWALLFRARHEEKALAEEFGQEWTDYRQRVPAWIPRWPAGVGSR